MAYIARGIGISRVPQNTAIIFLAVAVLVGWGVYMMVKKKP